MADLVPGIQALVVCQFFQFEISFKTTILRPYSKGAEKYNFPKISEQMTELETNVAGRPQSIMASALGISIPQPPQIISIRIIISEGWKG